MSMARCDLCRDLIDTDDDPEACVHDGYICEGCREVPMTQAEYEAQQAEWEQDERRAQA